MMNEVRPIDAEALEQFKCPHVRGSHGYSAKMEDWAVLVRDIRNAPTLDVEPVRHGRWEWETEDKYRCSECGNVTRVDEVMGRPVYERCPYCGAKMRREEE